MTFALIECGLSTALAPSVEATLAAITADKTVLFRNERFLGQDFQPQLCAFRDGDTIGRFADRARELLAEATEDFITRLSSSVTALSEARRNAIKLILLLPEVDEAGGLDKASLGTLGQELAANIQNAVNHACDLRFSSTVMRAVGHAGVGSAIADCFLEQRSDDSPMILIATVDSYSDHRRLNLLNDQKRLFSKQNQFGFVPGEAAGMLLFSGQSDVSSHPQVLGAGNFVEPTLEYEQAESAFTALSDAAFAAADMAAPRGQTKWINAWIADWNNSRYRATELSFAMHRLNPFCLQEGVEPVYPSLRLGDVGAAFGCLSIILARSQQSFDAAFNGSDADAHTGMGVLISAGSGYSGLRSAVIIQTGDNCVR